MTAILDACRDLPTRTLEPGEVLVAEGQPRQGLFVVANGSFEVSHDGAVVATIVQPGAVIGEISALLDTDHGATVTAMSAATVYEVADVHDFIVGDNDRLLEIARLLARRLNRLTSYLGDLRAQYGESSGHFALLDEVLSELTFGEQTPVEPGSERDPDPRY